jgi:hypothetical protein
VAANLIPGRCCRRSSYSGSPWKVADEIGANAALETDDLDHGTLKSRGGLPRALALFGKERLPTLLEELNTALAA